MNTHKFKSTGTMENTRQFRFVSRFMRTARVAVPLIGLLFTSPYCLARTLPTPELRASAIRWMDGHPVMGIEPKTITRLETVENTNDSVKIAHLAPQGYLILNVDDQRPLVAGFANEGTLDLNDGSAAWVETLLAAYTEKQAEAKTAPANTTVKMAAVYPTDIYIAPLVKTKWHQWEPFNNLMPEHGNKKLGNPRSPTGCGTIAIAQLMRAYQWPPYGQGSRTHADNDGLSSFYNADFSKPYPWSLMPNTYTTYTGKSADAVSRLVYDVSAAGNVVNEPLGSAIGLDGAAGSLSRHLFYDIGKWVFGDAECRLAIQENLRKKIIVPADISIDNQGNGHAILFDGLLVKNGQISYHTNYGWGGINNIWWDEDAIISVWQCQTGLQPGLIPLPPQDTQTLKKSDTWELPWKISPKRSAEANRITLYQEVSRNTTWSDNGDSLPETARSWSISPNGYSGSSWYVNGPNTEEILNINAKFNPSSSSTLSFQEKHVCGMNGMHVEASTDGNNYENLLYFGADIQHGWTIRTISLAKFAGKKIQIRFRYGTPPGTWYYSTEQGGGMWLDNLMLTNATLTTWEKLPVTGELVSIDGQNCTSRHQSRGAFPTGTYKLRASLTDNDGVEHAKGPVVSLKVVDKLPMAKLRIISGGQTKQSGDSLSFGTVKTGKTATRTLVIKNTGNLPLKNIRIAVEGAHQGEFKTTKPKPVLAPGTQSKVRITFRPGKAGQRTASIKISTDAGSITLKARGRGDG